MGIAVFIAAVDFQKTAEKIANFGSLHEGFVFVVGPVTRPDLGARLDIFQPDKNKIGMLADLLDRRVLKMRFDAVDFARCEIDSAHVGAIFFAVQVFVGTGFCPCTLRDRSDVMIIEGAIVFRYQSPAQLANHIPLFDFYSREKTVARVGDARFFDQSTFVVGSIDFQDTLVLLRFTGRKNRKTARHKNSAKIDNQTDPQSVHRLPDG